MGKTNEYFNSDIINQIYNKIDPHPTMKHIKFITEKDKEGLKTHVYTYDESECEKISPVVYLSSAQVNILSLCIFLSKVLSEKIPHLIRFLLMILFNIWMELIYYRL